MIRLSNEQFQTLIDKCVSTKERYTLYSSNSSSKLERQDGFVFYTGDDIPFKDILFILSLKARFKRLPVIEFKEATFFLLGNLHSILSPSVHDFVEIDIDSAYWQSAYNLGYIPKKVFDKGMKKDKVFRLRALGVLAKKEKVIFFDGKKERVKNPCKIDPHTTAYYNSICNHVYNFMQYVRAHIPEEDFIFSWVDGVFIKQRSVFQVISLMEKYNFKYKIALLKTINYNCTEKCITVHGLKNKEDVRPFMLPKNN